MKAERLVSVDALRGYTVAAMIVVNSPGSWSHVFDPLLHATWHGATLTDLVFPFFLFLVGVSIALAYGKRAVEGVERGALYRKIVFRSAKIFALGLFLSLWPNFDFESLRVAGVLQRIALVFLACAILFLNTSWRAQAWIGAALLLGYWAAMAWIPVPVDAVNARALDTGVVERSFGQEVAVSIDARSAGLLEPNLEPGTNLTAWIDRRLLPGRMWERSWDPEGLASALPAVATGILGMLAGALMLSVADPYRRVSGLFLLGFGAWLAGAAWGWVFPLNKNLWSSSFVLFSGGLATMALAACSLLADAYGCRRWAKVGVVFGANAVVTYALSGMLLVVFYGSGWGVPSASAAFMEWAIGAGLSGKLASLLYALLYLAALYVPAWWLWRKRIFVRL